MTSSFKKLALVAAACGGILLGGGCGVLGYNWHLAMVLADLMGGV